MAFDALKGRTCLVTGATGFLGSYVVERLVDAGASVRCLVRASSNCVFLPSSGIQFCHGDVTDPDSLSFPLRDVDYVFHLASLIKARSPSAYYRVNYLGTINLLEACQNVAPWLRRVVVVSSLAAVGPSLPGDPLDESSPCCPTTPYGNSKWQQEQVATAYSKRLPVTIIRPPSIYGPRDRETLAIFQCAALGLVPSLPVEGELSIVHAADAADGILIAATSAEAVGRTYFIAGDETPSYRELMTLIGTAVGRHGVKVPVSGWMLRLAGRIAEAAREVTGTPIIFDRWKAEEILGGFWACRNTRAKCELGFEPRVPLQRGLADTAKWYRAMGWLLV